MDVVAALDPPLVHLHNFHSCKRLYNKNTDNEKRLGVTVDANLNFNCHLENILKKS